MRGFVSSKSCWRRIAGLAIAASAVSIVACSEADTPASPVVRAAPPITPPPPPANIPNAVIQGPAPNGPGKSYAQATDIYGYTRDFHGGTISSRYVLYDDRTLALEFLSGRFGYFTYLGGYRQAGDSLLFAFNGSSLSGAWAAAASLRRDSLDVRYNLSMWANDFVDGVYVRDLPRAAAAISR